MSGRWSLYLAATPPRDPKERAENVRAILDDVRVSLSKAEAILADLEG